MLGNLDRFDQTVAGWALDETDPTRSVTVTLAQGGRLLHTCTADLYRSDVEKHHGSGHHGFSFDLDRIDGLTTDGCLEVVAEGSTRKPLGRFEYKRRVLVARGDGDWLFLQNDSNDVNARISGTRPTDSGEVQRMVELYLEREQRLRELDVPWLPLVIPEKNVVCQHLWRAHRVSEERPVRLLEAALRNRGSDPGYLIGEALASRDTFFLKTDTHPSAEGCLVIMRALAARCPRYFAGVATPVLRRELSFTGDLGEKLSPPLTEEAWVYDAPSGAEVGFALNTVDPAIADNATLRANVAVLRNPSAPHARVLVFGTSTAFRLLPYLGHAFRETFFVWENTLDYQLVRELSPALVMWIMTERLLPCDCDDRSGIPRARALLLDEQIRR